MELIEDKTKVELKDDVILVTRIIIEEYEAQDYLDSLKRLRSTIEQMEDKQNETREILDMILDEKIEKSCLDIIEKKKEIQKEEVAKAIEAENGKDQIKETLARQVEKNDE